MPATDSVTIVKRMTYRGVGEEWSNSYHLDGTTPTTDAEWKTLIDAIVASEKACYITTVKVVRGYGYVAGVEAAASTVDYTALSAEVAGTFAVGANVHAWAGDQAAMLRAKRTGNGEGGKPVYLRKYFHGGAVDQGYPEAPASGLKTAYVTHGTKMLSGTLPGSMVWVAPNGENATMPLAMPWMTTRTLKRRSKRPTPPQ